MSHTQRSHFFCALSFSALLTIGFSSAAHANIWTWPWETNSGASKSTASLPKLGADTTAVSVSGLSAGAYMAVQLHLAYSSSIMGAGIIAGGPWMCADGDVFRAQAACMSTPADVDVPDLLKLVKHAATLRQLDPLTSLSKTRVYIYNSPVDDVILAPMNAKNLEFYSALVPAVQIENETSIKSAHGMPTLSYGQACSDFGAPFLNNCAYDAAGETLKFIYSQKTLVRATADKASLHVFDQQEFGSSAALMNDTGWVYVPKKCEAANSNCPVHVALHGCLQTPDDIKDTFVVHAGYNEWAEGSGIIMLYPQAHTSLMNPKGCYDWWGYTGANYATKNGVQMKVIKAMMDRLTGS